MIDKLEKKYSNVLIWMSRATFVNVVNAQTLMFEGVKIFMTKRHDTVKHYIIKVSYT